MPPKRGGVHTLWSSGAGDAGNSDSDKEGRHFTGGHSSGLNVEDPNSSHPASSIIAAARANPRAAEPEAAPAGRKFEAFSGSGGSMASPAAPAGNTVSAGVTASVGPVSRSEPREIEVIVSVRLWKDGFQYAFGSEPLDPEPPVIPLDDPRFDDLKAAVARNRVPAFIRNEWISSASPLPPNAEPVFELRIMDNTGKDYQAPAGARKKGPSPFGGSGRTMDEAPPAAAAAAVDSADAPEEYSGPDVAKVKVRFADGSTKVISACPSWTGAQLTAYVTTLTSQPAVVLRRPLPPRDAIDESATVADAKLGNAMLLATTS